MNSRSIPLFNIWARMTAYGAIGGYTLGVLYALIVGGLLAPQYLARYNFVEGMYTLTIIAMVFGGLMGGLGGFMAGVIVGLVVALVSVTFFFPVRNQSVYQFVIEGISVAVAISVSYYIFRLLLSTVRIPASPVDQLYNVLPFVLMGLGGLISARLTGRWYVAALAGQP